MATDRIEDAYRRLHPRLWHALLAYGGNVEVASDAESEAFVQAIRRGDEIRDVDAWVWRSAFRIAAGLLKQRPLLVTSDEQAATRVDGSELQPHLIEFMSMLSDLTDQQRAIVALRYVGNFRATEIADLIDSSAASVRVQLHRAHKHLREVLLTEDTNSRTGDSNG